MADLSAPGGDMTDARMTPATCRAARTLLALSQIDLASRAKVGVVTLRNYENGVTGEPSHGTWTRIKRALEQAGAQFIDDDEASPRGGVGVRLRKPTR